MQWVEAEPDGAEPKDEKYSNVNAFEVILESVPQRDLVNELD